MSNMVVSPRASSNGSAPKDDKRSKDPYLGLRFDVDIQIDNVHVARFTECSGLSIETEVFEYAEGGLNTYKHRLPVRVKYNNITLKRGIDESMDLFTWYLDALEGKVTRKNISIIVYDPLKQQVCRWDVLEALPVKWTGPDLKADAGSLAVETLEIAHHGLVPMGGDYKVLLHKAQADASEGF